MMSKNIPQLITYKNQFEYSIAGLFYCNAKIDRPFVEENVVKMVQERFPEINLMHFKKAFALSSKEFAPSTISIAVFDALMNADFGIHNAITPVYSWKDEKMNKYIEWSEVHDDKKFNVFTWMCEKGIMEKASYDEVDIN
jgi:hypothetical protein